MIHNLHLSLTLRPLHEQVASLKFVLARAYLLDSMVFLSDYILDLELIGNGCSDCVLISIVSITAWIKCVMRLDLVKVRLEDSEWVCTLARIFDVVARTKLDIFLSFLNDLSGLQPQFVFGPYLHALSSSGGLALSLYLLPLLFLLMMAWLDVVVRFMRLSIRDWYLQLHVIEVEPVDERALVLLLGFRCGIFKRGYEWHGSANLHALT